jgi:hypothetical protein
MIINGIFEGLISVLKIECGDIFHKRAISHNSIIEVGDSMEDSVT